MCQVITKCRGAGKRSRERQLVLRRVYEGFRAACLTENSSNRLGHCLHPKRDRRHPSWPRAWTQRAKGEARERRGSEVDRRREGARPAVEGKEPPSGGSVPPAVARESWSLENGTPRGTLHSQRHLILRAVWYLSSAPGDGCARGNAVNFAVRQTHVCVCVCVCARARARARTGGKRKKRKSREL